MHLKQRTTTIKPTRNCAKSLNELYHNLAIKKGTQAKAQVYRGITSRQP